MVSKVLGYAIIVGSSIVKFPQIHNIWRSRSAEGLAVSMFVMELIGYVITVTYNIVNEFPFSTWGETFFVTIQNVVILYLIEAYTTKNFFQLFALFGGLGAFLISALIGVLPYKILSTLQMATIFIFSSSRIPQISSNFKNKSTGQLSMVTFLLSFVGGLARIFTTIQEVDDMIILVTFIIATILNGTVFFQILLYQQNTNKINQQKKTE
uniref:Mannose-P-dolichol utilization defect 1 protein homolog n=1 Tax=Arcella intermedia TaxID=1963864 RepID=A0A6B2LIX0_9EUKA